MNKTTVIISIFVSILAIFKISRCIIAKQPTLQTTMNERNIEKYGSYESRYKQWEAKYGKRYLESLNEEERAIFLKDVNCLTKATEDIIQNPPTTSWDSIKNDYAVISYPKNWVAKFDENSMVYTFTPKNPKVNKDEGHIFYVELVGISSIERLMSETLFKKENFFPEFTNLWWQQKANEGNDIRGIKKVKLLGYDAYCASGQIVRGETRFSSTMYLINAPQGIYQFTIIGNPESMIQYAKTAVNIIQTLNLRKEI